MKPTQPDSSVKYSINISVKTLKLLFVIFSEIFMKNFGIISCNITQN